MSKKIDSRVRVKTLRTKPQKPTSGSQRTYLRQLAAFKEQQDDALRLMVYFNKVWQRGMKTPDKIFSHPISRLYETVRPCNRFIVLFAANIWFERAFRGNSLSGKLSGWYRRKTPRLNRQTSRLVKDLMTLNSDAVQEMWTIASQKNTVEVVVKTSVTFANEEQADLFRELLSSLETQDEHSQDFGTDPVQSVRQAAQAEGEDRSSRSADQTECRSEESELRSSVLARHRGYHLVHGQEQS